jgi:hypothetical protein
MHSQETKLYIYYQLIRTMNGWNVSIRVFPHKTYYANAKTFRFYHTLYQILGDQKYVEEFHCRRPPFLQCNVQNSMAKKE